MCSDSRTKFVASHCNRFSSEALHLPRWHLSSAQFLHHDAVEKTEWYSSTIHNESFTKPRHQPDEKCHSGLIRNVKESWAVLSTACIQSLSLSLSLFRLDYCNSLLSGFPQYLLRKLQKVQNAAARLVCKAKKSDPIQLILYIPHWLPVTRRVQYQISTSCFNSLSGKSQYLSDLIQP